MTQDQRRETMGDGQQRASEMARQAASAHARRIDCGGAQGGAAGSPHPGRSAGPVAPHTTSPATVGAGRRRPRR